jgi:hypothetical protein
MYLKAMLIACKNIMLAPPAKAIAGLAQYSANEISYYISANKQERQQNNVGERDDAGLYPQTKHNDPLATVVHLKAKAVT